MRDSQKSRSQHHNPVALGRGPIRAILILALVAAFAQVAWIISPSPPQEAATCDQVPQRPPSPDTSAPADRDTRPPAIDTGQNLEAAATYAAGRGLVALAVIDRQTGSYVDNGANAHTPMGSASVVKVLIADELLYRDAQGEIELGPAELAQMETMIMDSNDSAASSLYGQFGGVSLIAAALTRHQLTESGPPVNPRYWGDTMVTAHDIATLYNNILEGSSISPADRDYLVSLMARMAPVATDGFGQLFGMAGLDPRPQAAVKQGWMCSSAGIRNVHSTAVLGPDNRYVTVILTSYDESRPYSYGQETATEVARLMLSELAL